MIKFEYDGAVIESALDDNSIKNLKSMFPADVVDAAVASAINEQAKRLRQLAYESESDPLFLEWQYDKTQEKENEWRGKVSEIKARYQINIDNPMK